MLSAQEIASGLLLVLLLLLLASRRAHLLQVRGSHSARGHFARYEVVARGASGRCYEGVGDVSLVDVYVYVLHVFVVACWWRRRW